MASATAISYRRTFGPLRALGAWLCLLLLSLPGCATYANRADDIRREFHAGNLDEARALVDKGLKRPKHDIEVLKLERAMLDLAAGRTREAEQTLREVRDRLDAYEQKCAAEGAVSLLTDDNAQAYAGEDYEKVLVRSFLAIANLMQGGGDAHAYSLQITDKQQQIIAAAQDKDGNNPKLGYKQVALGPYIHGLLREQTHSNYDDAARASAMVVSWQPEFAYGRQDLQRAQLGRHSPPGHGVLYVFTLVGRGPYKEQTEEIASSVSLLIADRIISATNKYTLPPTIAPIKVPKVVAPNSTVSYVNVLVDGRSAGATATITDVRRMALEQQEAVLPQVVAKAVVRRVVKKGVVYGAKQAIGAKRNAGVNIALDVAGVAWEASEAADTRCWSLLPEAIQVLRLELPAGVHQIALQTQGPYGAGQPAMQTVTISDAANTYLLANFPEKNLVGQITVSQP